MFTLEMIYILDSLVDAVIKLSVYVSISVFGAVLLSKNFSSWCQSKDYY